MEYKYLLLLDGEKIIGKASCETPNGTFSSEYTEVSEENYTKAKLGGRYSNGIIYDPVEI